MLSAQPSALRLAKIICFGPIRLHATLLPNVTCSPNSRTFVVAPAPDPHIAAAADSVSLLHVRATLDARGWIAFMAMAYRASLTYAIPARYDASARHIRPGPHNRRPSDKWKFTSATQTGKLIRIGNIAWSNLTLTRNLLTIPIDAAAVSVSTCAIWTKDHIRVFDMARGLHTRTCGCVTVPRNHTAVTIETQTIVASIPG